MLIGLLLTVFFVLFTLIVSVVIILEQPPIGVRLFFIGLQVIILVILIRNYFFYRKRRKIREEERAESLREGGIEEPRILRELTGEETAKLKGFHNTSKLVTDNLWWLLPGSIIVDLLIFWFLYTYPEMDEDLRDVFFLPFAIQFLLISLALKEVPRYLDLRSPVYRVQGKFLEGGSTKSTFVFKVRGVKFKISHTSAAALFRREKLKEEDEVAVEYSPRTKHVWKIYKTPDI
jgi:hypothetical protein